MRSSRLLLWINPQDIAMFRFLLEAHENLALFTVLDRREALLKIIFSPSSMDQVMAVLDDIGKSVFIRISPWPVDSKNLDNLLCQRQF